jgi:hypothetical protein
MGALYLGQNLSQPDVQNSSHSSLLLPATASFLGLAIVLVGAAFGFGKAVVEPCRTEDAGRTLYAPSSLNTLTTSVSLAA